MTGNREIDCHKGCACMCVANMTSVIDQTGGGNTPRNGFKFRFLNLSSLFEKNAMQWSWLWLCFSPPDSRVYSLLICTFKTNSALIVTSPASRKECHHTSTTGFGARICRGNGQPDGGPWPGHCVRMFSEQPGLLQGKGAALEVSRFNEFSFKFCYTRALGENEISEVCVLTDCTRHNLTAYILSRHTHTQRETDINCLVVHL